MIYTFQMVLFLAQAFLKPEDLKKKKIQVQVEYSCVLRFNGIVFEMGLDRLAVVHWSDLRSAKSKLDQKSLYQTSAFALISAQDPFLRVRFG